MLELVTGVSVVMVFGVRVRRTDRMDCWGPRHWHGTWTVSWTGDSGASAQLVFGLLQTRGHGRKDEGTSTLFVRRAAKQRRIDRRAQRRGRTLDGERLQKKDAVPDMLGQVSSSFWV